METTPIFSADDFLIDMRNELPDDILRIVYFDKRRECMEAVSSNKRTVLNELRENTKQVGERNDNRAILRREIELRTRPNPDPHLFEIYVYPS